MADFLTFADIAGFKGPPPSTTLIEKAASRSVVGATFLSHSTLDIKILPTIINILEGHGATTYVDKKDPTLPTVTSPQTAAILRNNISRCAKFVLLVTVNSGQSKWVPWELGLADGEKSPNKIALFPVSEEPNDHAWAEREYLGLYDRIVWDKFEGQAQEWVVMNHHDHTGVPLGQWLKR